MVPEELFEPLIVTVAQGGVPVVFGRINIGACSAGLRARESR
jgi:hypothetical protein